MEQKKICPTCNNKCSQEDLFCNKCGYEFEQMVCWNCGKEFTENDMFCKSCGKQLQEKISILKCPQCGLEYSGDEIYCEDCGTKLITEERINKINKNNSTLQSQFNTNNNLATVEKSTQEYSNKVKCPYCGSKIERYSKKCPQCGEWLGGVSHFGCGGFMMIVSIIFAIAMAIGAENLNIPIIGEVGGIYLVITAFLYFLPSLIAEMRGHESKIAIFIVNLLFGWTILGWLITLIFSFTGRSR